MGPIISPSGLKESSNVFGTDTTSSNSSKTIFPLLRLWSTNYLVPSCQVSGENAQRSLHLRSRKSVSARLRMAAGCFPRSTGHPGSCFEPTPIPQPPTPTQLCGAQRRLASKGLGKWQRQGTSPAPGSQARPKRAHTPRPGRWRSRSGRGERGRKPEKLANTPTSRGPRVPARWLGQGCPRCALRLGHGRSPRTRRTGERDSGCLNEA